jgi:trimeric autotransporter adhesin
MKQFFTLLVLAFAIVHGAQAQLTGTKTIPGDYPTLADAVTALNAQGVGTGGVTLLLGANQSLGATVQLGSATLSTGSAAASQANPITLDGGGFTINAAFAGTRTGGLTASLANDASLAINGTDYVTIKNCVFTQQAGNTTTATAIENAIALHNRNAASPFDGCQNITIQTCTFNMGEAATGGAAIHAAAHVYGGTTALAWGTAAAAPGDMHRDITITNNNFNGYNFVNYFGATSNNGRKLMVNNNTITDIGGAAVAAYGLYGRYIDSCTFNNNTASMSATQSTTNYIAFLGTNAGGYQEANGNDITIQAAVTSSQTAGLFYTSIGSDRKMNNNIVRFGPFSAITSATVYGVYGAYTGGNNNVTFEMNGNSCTGQTLPGIAATTSAIVHILNNSANTGTNRQVMMKNNTITNNTRSGGGTTYALFPGTADAVDVSGNTIDNFTWNNTSASSSANFYGLYGNGSPTSQKIYNNTVSNVNITGSSTNAAGTTQGIRSSTVSTGTAEVYGNTVFGLAYGSGTHTGNVTGIFASNSSNAVYKNKVYGLVANQTAGTVNGINLSSGPSNNVYNNLISDLSAPAATGTNAVIGINVSGGTTANLSFNTVFPSSNGALASSGASFGGSGIYVSSTVATNIRNNIVNMTGTAATGYFAAIKRNGGTAGVNPTNLLLSNNIYHSPYIYGEGVTEASATNLYYVSGGTLGTADPNFNTACGLFKSWKGDVGSFTEDNLTGSAGIYQPSGSSYAESGGTTATTPAITDDYNGVTRNATAPDMGAIEFSGTLNDASGPTINYTPIATQNCSNAPSLNATITDASNVNTSAGNRPRLYYKKHSEANAWAGNTSANNGWKYVEAPNTASPFTFTIDYSLLTAAPTGGDTIHYFVVAQDLAATPNLGTNLGSYPTGFCPTSVALTAPAFPVAGFRGYLINPAPIVTVKASPITVCTNNNDTLTVQLSLPGNVTVGNGTATGSTYTPYYGSTTLARRIQYLFTAAELKAQGLRAGDITSVSFDIAVVPTAFSIGDFSIKMGHTNLAVIGSNFSGDATTTVLPAGSYTPVVGINTHILSTPFNWDGVSNILLEACHGVAGTGSLTTVRYTSGLPTGISCYSTNVAGCAQATGTTTTIRANITFTGQRDLNGGFTNFAWNDGSGPVGNNNDTIIVQPAFASGNSITYSVTATDANGCTFNGNVIVTKNTTAPALTSPTVSPANLCFGDSVTLSVPITGGCPPYTYAYTFTPTAGTPMPITVSANNKYLPSVSGSFQVTVTDNASQSTSGTVGSITMLAPPTAAPVSRCGTGPVSMTATGVGGSFYWYNAATGGTFLTSGATYTPTVTATTDFYVETANVAAGVITGRTASTAPGTTTSLSTYGQQFTLTKTITLNSVDVFSSTGTALTIALYNAGGTIQLQTTGSVTTASNAQTTVPLGWTLAPGTYRLHIPAMTGNYFRENSGPVYPIALATSGNIDGFFSSLTGSNTTSASYYFMYNWNIDEICGSSRTLVTATVTVPPALATMADATVCNNESRALNVTSPLANFNGYIWSPVAGLFTDAAGTTPYTGQNLTTVYVKNPTGGTTNYVVTGSNSATQCANTDTVAITVMPATTLSATPSSICLSGTTTVSINPATGYGTGSLQWQQSPTGTAGSYTDISGQTGVSYTSGTISSNTWYGLQLKDGAGNTCALRPTTSITINSPAVTGTTPGSSCGPDSVALAATGSAGTTLRWYTAPTGGLPVFTGTNYKTPVISSSTNYYVSAGAGISNSTMGRSEAQAGTSGTTAATYGLCFDALSNITIDSVTIILASTSAGTLVVELRDSLAGSTGPGTFVRQTASIPIPAGTVGQRVRIPLGFAVPAGNGYRLLAISSPSLIRSSAAGGFPYVAGDATATITSGFITNGGSTTYYYFYDWAIKSGCESPRTLVTATINPLSGQLAGTAGGAQVCKTDAVNTGRTYYNNSCDLIAKVLPGGAAPIAGQVSTCVKIDGTVQTFNGEPYVQRHYDIEPTVNAANATATVTLYFKDHEFVGFNTVRGIYPALPTVAGGGNADANIANLRVTQYHGTGTAPGNYTGPAEYINPADNDIVWNATDNRWEVTIPVTGFSGFYIHTGANPIPVKIEYFRGSKQDNNNLLSWKVVPVNTNTGTMELQHSANGRSFGTLYSITATATQMQQPFSYADARTLSGVHYYRLKVTDDNGVVNYSTIVALISSGKSLQLISIAPNPVAGSMARLNITAAQPGKLELVINDAQGRLVQRSTLSLAAGFTAHEISVGKLAAGIYQVYGISVDGRTQALRLVKQ